MADAAHAHLPRVCFELATERYRKRGQLVGIEFNRARLLQIGYCPVCHLVYPLFLSSPNLTTACMTPTLRISSHFFTHEDSFASIATPCPGAHHPPLGGFPMEEIGEASRGHA